MPELKAGEVLIKVRAAGVKDLSQYAAVPGTPDKDLLPDFFLEPARGARG